MREIDILARTLWGEARGEGEQGMKAVACVVLNRVKKAQNMGGNFWWGHDIQSVCLKPWQFSCWNRNDPNREKMRHITKQDPFFFQALLVAKQAIDGELIDITCGADHYHTIYIHPFWSKEHKPVCQIGHHLFYRIQP